MEPILLGPGEGERVSDSVVIKAGRSEVAVTESDYEPGESGPGPHVHRRHADCFYVLDGELAFEVGPEGDAFKAPTGTYVQVPPNVVHTFRNEAFGDASFLNFHAPGEGFDEHLRAMRDGRDDESDFDTFDPPEDGGRPASDVIVRGRGEGREVRLGATSVLIKSGADDDPGSIAIMESTLPPGFPGPVLHRHVRTTDSFFVLSGTLTLRLGEREIAASSGTYVLIPPGEPHTFSNDGDKPVRVLNVMLPGGFERYFEEAAAALPADAPPDPAVLAEVASRHDFEPAA